MKVVLLIKFIASFYFLMSVVVVVALSSPVVLAPSSPSKKILTYNNFDWKTNKCMENLTYDKIEVPGTHKEVQSVLT